MPDTDFIARDPNNFSWNVVRSEFDELLLRHAGESGASLHEGVRVNTIKFSEENPQRPVSAEWKSDEGTGEIKFNWLVDASGRNGLMSTKYLKNRKFNASLRNVAFWGYWTGAGKYGKGTPRENAPWFEALTGASCYECFPLSLLKCAAQTRPVGPGSSPCARTRSPSVSFCPRPPARSRRRRSPTLIPRGRTT